MSNAAQITGFEELVRYRAYALWEREGRPFGRDLEHWRASEEATRAEMAVTPKLKAPRKPAPRKSSAKRATLFAEMPTSH